ncbi:MAG: hypothetical protein HKN92_00690 [Chitinophagales bacterium]|nr:hypothetical protein [Chitinophagales bacterium]
MEQIRSIEEYIEKSPRADELKLLRKVAIDSGLEETIKWSSPVYTYQGKNIIGIGAFKAYSGIWFYQGVYLKDEQAKLINAQEGKTKALRQWRFFSIKEIKESLDLIKAYILEAIDNQEAGIELKVNRQKPLIIPKELINFLQKNPDLKESFESFSKSKQREFAVYIAEAKRPETKEKRLEKIKPLISKGIGLHDKYR